MSVQPEVTRLRQQHGKAAAGCLTRAFLPDPLWLALLPDAGVREKQLTGKLRATVRTAVHGGLPLATPGLTGVAVWQPPRRPALRSMLRTGFPTERWLLSLPAPERRRVAAVFRRLSERREALMPSPFWYLEAIGVEPTHQGRGLGGALLRDGLTRADEAGLPAYLETEAESLVSMFSHVGFRVLQEVHVPEVRVPLWLMRREPVQHPQIHYEQI